MRCIWCAYPWLLVKVWAMISDLNIWISVWITQLFLIRVGIIMEDAFLELDDQQASKKQHVQSTGFIKLLKHFCHHRTTVNVCNAQKFPQKKESWPSKKVFQKFRPLKRTVWTRGVWGGINQHEPQRGRKQAANLFSPVNIHTLELWV